MAVLMSVFWILFSILQSVHSQAFFISPTASGLYLFNEPVTVTVVFSTNTTSVEASMVCGTTTSADVMFTSGLFSALISPPNDYVGLCTVNGIDQDNVSLTPVNIQIIGELTITSPSTSSPLAKYPAGSSFPVSWTYTPSSPSATTISLTCATPGAGTSTLSNATSSPANLTISTDSYGYNCALSLVPSDSSYVLSSPVYLTVSQQLTFTFPNSGYSYPSTAIPVLLATAPCTSVSALVPIVLQCASGGGSSSSVTTNLYQDYPVPSGYAGLCTFIPAPDSPDQDYLVIPSSTMSFYLKNSLTFSLITSSPVAGGPFSFQMDTNSVGEESIDVGLYCDNDVYQTWNAIPVNTLYDTALYSSVPTGVDCILQTVAASDYYFQANSSSFTISPNPITITSPSAGAYLASGSPFSVTWSSSTPQAEPSFNASLACTGFSTLTSITTLFNTSLSIPSTYYGASCTVSVADTGSNIAQVSVVVTQSLSFSTPTDGDIITLNTTSFPVKLITSGANVYTNVSVSFQCGGGSSIYNNFAANTDSLTQSVLPYQIGSCSLVFQSAPAYLVYPPFARVSFTLKYTLTFVTLPTTLYLNQSFTIQINTTIPASNPPPATLYLICPSGLVSDTWPNVLINQPNSLLLSSTTPLESCVFKVNSSIS